jgi:hypothetical protein
MRENKTDQHDKLAQQRKRERERERENKIVCTFFIDNEKNGEKHRVQKVRF